MKLVQEGFTPFFASSNQEVGSASLPRTYLQALDIITQSASNPFFGVVSDVPRRDPSGFSGVHHFHYFE
jgi:hypothetical protein